MDRMWLRLTSLLSVTALMTITVAAFAQSSAVIDVEPWLDRIDKIEAKYLNEESQGLSFDEKAKRSYPPAEGDVEVQRFATSKIVGSVPATKLDMTKNALAKLEHQIILLDRDIAQTKQKVIEKTSANNYIDIKTIFGPSDAAAIRSLSVKLDGYEIFELGTAAGLWLPSKSLPLYSGPLKPGDHRIDIHAVAVLRKKDGMPLNEGAFREGTKSIPIRIPDGIVRQRIVVEIQPPKTASEGVLIALTEQK